MTPIDSTVFFAAAPTKDEVIWGGRGLPGEYKGKNDGEEEFQTKFVDWSHRLRLVLATKMRVEIGGREVEPGNVKLRFAFHVAAMANEIDEEGVFLCEARGKRFE